MQYRSQRAQPVRRPTATVAHQTKETRPAISLEREARRAADHAVDVSPASGRPAQRVEAAPPSGGEPLPEGVRRRFEPAFRHDFRDVRVHRDGDAENAAQVAGARAFTVGSHIVFGARAYAPDSASGERLLAHELAHVVQQRGGPAFMQREPLDPARSPASTTQDPADAEIAAREAALKNMKGLDAGNRVGSGTAAAVEALIEASSLLRPYIRDKVVSTSVGKNFTIYDFAEQFDAKQAKLDGVVSPDGGAHKGELVYGFYHRKTDSIHLRPDANLGHALHEGVHKYSSVSLQSLLGIFVNEGITQMYADEILAEHKVPGKVNHAYGPQVEAAEVLASWFSKDELGEAYFEGKGGTHIDERLRQELAITSKERVSLAGGNDGADLADEIVKRKGKPSRAKPLATDARTPKSP